jgi:HEAT repeat protein
MVSCAELVDQLSGEDTEALREAAFRAGEMACEEAVPRLAGMLESHNLGVQEAAENALRRIGGQNTVQHVIPLLRSEEAPVRNLSMDILRQVGEADFGALVDLLHDTDPDIRIFASDILGSTGQVMAVAPLCESLLKDPETNVRYQAAVSLGDLNFSEAAKCLNQALGDEEWVQFAVIEALAKIRDETSVSALVRALDTSSDLVASMIVEALGEMGNVKAAAMLLKRMGSSPTALRNKMVKAIVKILGAKSLTLLSEHERANFRDYLLVALEDEEWDIQEAAAQGLAHVGGEKATRAILDLASRMDPDRDAEYRESLVSSLARIGYNKALAQGLDGQDARARVTVSVMSRLSDPEVSLKLMESFWDKDRDLQRMISQALLQGAGEEAAGFFRDILERHGDGDVLKDALAFLGGKLQAVDVAEQVFAMLDHPYDDVKEAALDACVAINGPDLAERFTAMFASPEPIKRLMAVYALGRMGVGEHLDLLKSALEDEIPDIRKVALEAIAETCMMEEETLPLVVSRLSDENREVRLTVVEQFGRCFSERVVPHLMQALDDSDDWVRIRAMEALSSKKVKEAIPALVTSLDTDNKLIALKIIECLGEIGGQAAFRSLLDVSNSEDPEMQTAAEDAINRMQASGEDG